MASHPIAAQVALADSQRRFFSNVFSLMAAGMGITALIAWWVSSDKALMTALFHLQTVMEDGKPTETMTASAWWWIAVAVELALVFFISGGGLTKRISAGTAIAAFALFAAINGFMLAPVLYAYTAASTAKVFAITAAMFGGCALWGYTTRVNLLPLATFFMMALLGLVAIMILTIFFPSPLADLAISAAAVVLFAGLTAYDMQMLRQLHSEDGNAPGLVVFGALALYLDFLNLFLHLLRLFGVKVKD